MINTEKFKIVEQIQFKEYNSLGVARYYKEYHFYAECLKCGGIALY